MAQVEFYNGIMYQIQYHKELSNNDYTQHHVYTVKTECESYTEAHTAIESIMDDGSWREGYYKFKNNQEPSMVNATHSYHKFSYNEETDEFRYELAIPYVVELDYVHK